MNNIINFYNMTYYLILDDPKDIKEIHEFFIIKYCEEVDLYWILIKLNENDLKDFNLSGYSNFHLWTILDETERPKYEFLKSKHTFYEQKSLSCFNDDPSFNKF